MKTKDRLANCIPVDTLLAIEGVVDVEEPVELNAMILVMDDGKKYRMMVEEETEGIEEEMAEDSEY